MSEKIRYTDEPLGDLRVVPDFLPSPEDLAFREEEDDPVTPEERGLLDTRLADLEANPGDQSPWPEVGARLEQRPR